MKELLENCPNIKKTQLNNLIDELGFYSIEGVSGTSRFGDSKYLIITKQKIQEYLIRKLEEKRGNIELNPIKWLETSRGNRWSEHLVTKDCIIIGKGNRSFALWREEDYREYPFVPPLGVLEIIKKQKELNHFDCLRIATVEVGHILPDPFLIGRINGNSARFFITQWGNDLKIEDII